MKVVAQRIWRTVEVLHLSALLLFVVAAPTVGDIGSCGAEPSDLDARAFFSKKAEIDCARCRECAIDSVACDRACDPAQAPLAFVNGCFPTVHDGDVCLRALEATTCTGYEAFVTDQGAIIPTECNFCPAEGAP